MPSYVLKTLKVPSVDCNLLSLIACGNGDHETPRGIPCTVQYTCDHVLTLHMDLMKCYHILNGVSSADDLGAGVLVLMPTQPIPLFGQINDSKFLLSPPGVSWLYCCWAVEFGILYTCKPLVAVWHGIPRTPLHQHHDTRHTQSIKPSWVLWVWTQHHGSMPTQSNASRSCYGSMFAWLPCMHCQECCVSDANS